jgi:hypothetical protein
VARHRLLDQVEPILRHAVDRHDGVLRRIGLIGVDGEVGVLANALADRLDAGDIVLDVAVHLDLEIAVALIEELRRGRCHLGRCLDRQDAQHWHLVAHLAAEEIVERDAERAGAEVVQRAVDPGLGLARADERAIERHENSFDRERILAEHMRLEVPELGGKRLEGRAHVR